MRDVNGRILTVGETAAYLKVHTSTIYRLLRKQAIPAFKIGGDWRFREQNLEQWLGQLARGELKANT